jgi:hypothetical protein
MMRVGDDVQVTRYGHHGWRATFYPAGIAHSLTPMVGVGLDAGAVGGWAAGSGGHAINQSGSIRRVETLP